MLPIYLRAPWHRNSALLPRRITGPLRSHAGVVIAKICAKFSGLFPDLQARVCKTFVDALQPDKSLPSMYGGLVGLSALGQNVVRTILLPIVGTLAARVRADANSKATSQMAKEMVTSALVKAVGMYYVRATQMYVLAIAPAGKVAGQDGEGGTPSAKRRKVQEGESLLTLLSRPQSFCRTLPLQKFPMWAQKSLLFATMHLLRQRRRTVVYYYEILSNASS